MTATSTHKRGDTFSRVGEIIVTQNGVRQLNLTGWTGVCQLRDKSDTKVADLNFTWVDASLSLAKLDSSITTRSWPLGVLYTDIQLTSPGGIVVSTDTTVFEIVKDQSRV